MRIGVLGGTFDPPHIGHLILAEAALEQHSLDRVIFVPAGIQWRKAGRQVALAEHRVAMVRLALEDNPAFELSTLEVERPGPSYTADTLEALQAQYTGAQLFFIVGRDALADMPNWVRPERILELATVAVAERAGETGAAGEVPAVRIEMPEIGVSATDIRERVVAGRTIRYLVPAAVEAYIREQRLYKNP